MPSSFQSGQFRPQQAYHVETGSNAMGEPHPTFHGDPSVAPYTAENRTTAGSRMAWRTRALNNGGPVPISDATYKSNVDFNPQKPPTSFTK
jgi:hypothetical protein